MIPTAYNQMILGMCFLLIISTPAFAITEETPWDDADKLHPHNAKNIEQIFIPREAAHFWDVSGWQTRGRGLESTRIF